MDTCATNKDGNTPLQLVQRRTIVPRGFLEALHLLLSEIRARNQQLKAPILRGPDVPTAENDKTVESFVNALECQ